MHLRPNKEMLVSMIKKEHKATSNSFSLLQNVRELLSTAVDCCCCCRFCLIIFTTFTIVTTIAVLFSAPHILVE